MILTVHMPAAAPDDIADRVRNIAAQIESGFTNGLIQVNDDEHGFWDSEGLAE